MSVNEYSGQPGNVLPITAGTTSDRYNLDYPLQAIYRRNVVRNSSQAFSVSASQSGSLICYGGNASGITITLPAPEKGLWFQFAATGDISSAATIFTCGTSGAFVTPGDSGGCDSLVAGATTAEFAIAGPGITMEFIGLSTAQYRAFGAVHGSSAASTGVFLISS